MTSLQRKLREVWRNDKKKAEVNFGFFNLIKSDYFTIIIDFVCVNEPAVKV